MAKGISIMKTERGKSISKNVMHEELKESDLSGGSNRLARRVLKSKRGKKK